MPNITKRGQTPKPTTKFLKGFLALSSQSLNEFGKKMKEPLGFKNGLQNSRWWPLP